MKTNILRLRIDLFQIRIDLVRVRNQLWNFTVPDPDPVHIIWTYLKIDLKKHFIVNAIKKENLPTICHILFHTRVLQYTQSRIHRLKIRNIFFFYLLLLFFCWILNNNSGSWSRQKFPINADPEPQHWTEKGTGVNRDIAVNCFDVVMDLSFTNKIQGWRGIQDI